MIASRRDKNLVVGFGLVSIVLQFILVLRHEASAKDLTAVILTVFTALFAWKSPPPDAPKDKELSPGTIQQVARIAASLVLGGEGGAAPSSRSASLEGAPSSRSAPPPLPAEPTPASAKTLPSGAVVALCVLLMLSSLV